MNNIVTEANNFTLRAKRMLLDFMHGSAASYTSLSETIASIMF